MESARVAGIVSIFVLISSIAVFPIATPATSIDTTNRQSILITDVSPSPGNVLKEGSKVEFEFTIDTVGMDGPRYVTASVNEHEWGEIDKEIKITEDDEPVQISITESINESWKIATLSFSLYSNKDSYREAEDTDHVIYGVGKKEAENVPPTARMNCGSKEVKVGEPINCSAENSIDPDGEISFYKWTIGGLETEFGAAFEHIIEEPGSYAIEVVVRDEHGAIDTTSRVIGVTTISTAVDDSGQTTPTPTNDGKQNGAEGTQKTHATSTPSGEGLLKESTLTIIALLLALLDMSYGFKRIKWVIRTLSKISMLAKEKLLYVLTHLWGGAYKIIYFCRRLCGDYLSNGEKLDEE